MNTAPSFNLNAKMISVPNHLSAILTAAAKKAMPELPDQMVVQQAEKGKDFQYTSPSAMKFFNQYKKAGSFGFATCQVMAQCILDNMAENDAIEKLELAQVGKGPVDKSGFFINIFLKHDFIERNVASICHQNEVQMDLSASSSGN